MQAVEADIAYLIEALAADVSEGQVATQVRRPLRPIVFNLISFVLVLVVAGLLLRVGSSEQAFSSISQERLGSERPAKTLVALPQPAFAQIAASHGGGHEGADNNTLAIAAAAKISREATHAHAPAFEQVFSALGVKQDDSNSGRIDVIRSAKVLARIPSAPEATAMVSAAIAPALSSSSVRASRTESSSPRDLAIMPEVVKPGRLSTAVADSNTSPLFQHGVGVARLPPHQEIAAPPAKQAPRAKTVVMATLQAPLPTILSPTHTSIVAGLLAPARLVTRSASLVVKPPTLRASVITGAQPTAAGSAAMLSAGSRRGSARQQVPTASATPRAVDVASAINGAAPASASITPVKISLAPLTMRPGPRTTVRTSNIKAAMRRPASAWA